MILDPCCGSKMFWFDKQNEDVVYGDVRKENHILCDGRTLEIKPDVQMDFTAIPFPDNCFSMVVLDPPHLVNLGKNSWMAKKYGILSEDWKTIISLAFSECFRVLFSGGTLIFKWNETQIPVSEITKLTEARPLFGHIRAGKSANTHWICFIKD